MQNRDFSLIIIVSVAPKASRLGNDQSRKAAALGIGERTNCGGGFFLFFCSVSYTKNYKVRTGISQDKKLPQKTAGRRRRYLKHSILICCICTGDRKGSSLSDIVFPIPFDFNYLLFP